jgi:hypothetical protein
VVTLRVGNDRVVFDGVCWRGADAQLVWYLQLITPYDLNSPSIPSFDVYVAEYVLTKLDDAVIIEVSPAGDGDDTGVVY